MGIKTKKKLIVKRFLLPLSIILIIILAAIFIKYSTETTSSKAALVNGETITLDELDARYNQLSPTVRATITKEDFLNSSLITEKLLLQKAEKQGIKTSKEEAEEFFYFSLQQFGITEEELEEQLKMQNMDKDDLLDLYEKRIMITKLLDQVLQADISDEEAKEYYENNTDLFKIPEKVRAAHILIKTDNRTKEEAREEIEEIRQEITETNFAELALKYSEDPGSKSNGGEYTFGKGEMVEEFENTAFSLNVGEISEPVETTYGFHIIKLLEKIPGKTENFNDVKDQMKNQLLSIKQEQMFSAYVAELRKKAEIKIFPLIETPAETTTSTFIATGDSLCVEDGKPVIRLYTTSWCPHCAWTKDAFDSVVSEYIKEGKIVAYHWELDTGDDLLTEEKENKVPQSEMLAFSKYDPQGGVPAFVFGCKFVRIGNGYEMQNDLKAEEAEFRAIIEGLI